MSASGVAVFLTADALDRAMQKSLGGEVSRDEDGVGW